MAFVLGQRWAAVRPDETHQQLHSGRGRQRSESCQMKGEQHTGPNKASKLACAVFKSIQMMFYPFL